MGMIRNAFLQANSLHSGAASVTKRADVGRLPGSPVKPCSGRDVGDFSSPGRPLPEGARSQCCRPHTPPGMSYAPTVTSPGQRRTVPTPPAGKPQPPGPTACLLRSPLPSKSSQIPCPAAPFSSHPSNVSVHTVPALGLPVPEPGAIDSSGCHTHTHTHTSLVSAGSSVFSQVKSHEPTNRKKGGSFPRPNTSLGMSSRVLKAC